MTSLTIALAPAGAVKWFLCGNIICPERFSHASRKDIQRFRTFLKGCSDERLRPYVMREDVDLLKRDLLRGMHSARTRALRRELDQCVLRRHSFARGEKLAHGLALLWEKHAPSVEAYFASVKNRKRNTSYAVYTMPFVGESSNSIGDTLVIGDAAPVTVAFGVLLEELIHAALPVPPKRDFGMATVSDQLFCEAYAGAHLYCLLTQLRYPSRLIDSLVFGWWDGKRTALVRRILKKI